LKKAAISAPFLSFQKVATFVRPYLLGGFNPSEKYARQIGSFSQFSGEHKKYLSCHQVVIGIN